MRQRIKQHVLTVLAGCALIGLAFGVPVCANAATIFVKASAPAGGNGQTWGRAFRDLQDALALASSTPGTHDIWVAQGTYKPAAAADPTASFVVSNGTSIYGGFAGNETSLAQRNIAAHPTILSGDLAGNDVSNRADPAYAASRQDNADHVVTIVHQATVTLDGLTVTAGYAHGPLTAPPFSGTGGGIYVRSDGFAGVGSDFGVAHLTLRNVTVAHNEAVGRAPGRFGGGGGLWQPAGTLVIDRSTFTDNVSRNAGGALVAGYFDLPSAVDSIVITDSSFTNNLTTFFDGVGTLEVRAHAFDIQRNDISHNVGPETVLQLLYPAGTNVLGKALLAGNTFAWNQATTGQGGALQAFNPHPSASADPVFTIRGNTFTHNTSSDLAGAVMVTRRGDFLIEANVFTHNTAGFGGGALYATAATGSVIVRGNQFVQNTVAGTPPTMDFLDGQASAGLFYSPVLAVGGGAMVVEDGSNVTLESNVFNGNAAPFGGAISVPGYGFLAGERWDYAEGLPDFAPMQPTANEPVSLTIAAGNAFLNNQATRGDGGGLFSGAVTTPATPFLGGTFPAITAYGATSSIVTDSAFQQNQAAVNGGAIAGDRTSALVMRNQFFKDDAAAAGAHVRFKGSVVNSYSTTTQGAQALQSLVSGNTFKAPATGGVSLQ